MSLCSSLTMRCSMRNIRVSTDVFAEIWSQRREGENSEDAVLRRVLGISSGGSRPETSVFNPAVRGVSTSSIRWVDDVVQALSDLGGRASLPQIYKKVKEIRQSNSRSTPPSLEEVVRKEIETHSSDSDVFQGREDYFWAPEGKGAGIWALRVSVELEELV